MSYATNSNKGFSLVELMVVVALMLVVGLAISNLFLNTQKTFKHTNSRIKARQEASFALRTMEKELRQIAQASDDFEAIEIADKNQLLFFADIDNDEKPEKITYALNGQNIVKTVVQTSNEAAPWEFLGAQTSSNLTIYSKNTALKPIFTYYSAMDEALSALPLSKVDRENIKIVKIDVRISVSADVQKEDYFETEVYLRNKNDPL
jgi:prepilin-type N-terminal cleavage/methylation domain-containing protein